MMDKSKLIQICEKYGADKVGVASIERFEGG